METISQFVIDLHVNLRDLNSLVIFTNTFCLNGRLSTDSVYALRLVVHEVYSFFKKCSIKRYICKLILTTKELKIFFFHKSKNVQDFTIMKECFELSILEAFVDKVVVDIDKGYVQIISVLNTDERTEKY